MTISILVLNKDSRKNAIISVKTQTEKGEVTSTKDKILVGGEFAEVLVHNQQRIVVEEVKNG